MSFNDFHNAEAIRLCVGNVLIDVALRVNDNSHSRGGVAHHVARVGETFEVVLLKEHIHHPLD
jgi:hypothetical protein